MYVINLTSYFNRKTFKAVAYSAHVTPKLIFDFFIDQRLAMLGTEDDVCAYFC